MKIKMNQIPDDEDWGDYPGEWQSIGLPSNLREEYRLTNSLTQNY